MSRIERALEKAAEKRSGERFGGAQDLQAHHLSSPPPQKTAAEHGAAFDQVPRPELDNPFLVTALDPHSPVSEQYRKLKSLIVKLTHRGTEKNCLLVTSTVGGEGKTITALNLAITLAQEFDHTVLLVEADIRRPTVLKYLGLERQGTAGLTDCILDGLDVRDALVKTGIGKLSVLPAGKTMANPVELFSSQRMAEVIAEIKHRYPDRFVIIDTTPLLPFAEPHYLANLVDGVIFVVRQNHTPLDKVKEALASLKNHHLLGVVCNDMDASFVGNGYYGYYGYYGYKQAGQGQKG